MNLKRCRHNLSRQYQLGVVIVKYCSHKQLLMPQLNQRRANCKIIAIRRPAARFGGASHTFRDFIEV